MRFLVLTTLIFCFGAGAAEKAKTVPAWQNCIDEPAAKEAMCVYTSNVIRCEWAGEDSKIANLMPANLGFQFAVIGDSDVTNRVQRILNEVVDSFKPEVRQRLEKYGMINSTLQWIVRTNRPGVTNLTEYLQPKNHPAAFNESDFDLDCLKRFASRLSLNNIPVPVTVQFGYANQMSPLGKAEPGIDYSDILPEETFLLPFGCAIVPRAIERRRKIRLSAQSWPYGKPVEFLWKSTGWPIMAPWDSSGYKTPERGYVDITYDVKHCSPRQDIMVWAKLGKGLYGPPTIISIYNVPYAQRTYNKNILESISYVTNVRSVPFDITQIWVPHEWKDVFDHNANGQIFTFERLSPGCIHGNYFSALGEQIHETSSGGFPTKTSKVEYFISPDTGMLDYREVGEEITYRPGQSPYRRSGE